MPEQPLVNKPDRVDSPHPDFSSGEDYKRWRDCSSHEKQGADFLKEEICSDRFRFQRSACTHARPGFEELNI